MTLYQKEYRIESARLKSWDYASSGYYFITVCTKNKECLFGDIVDDKIILNEYGKIVSACWYDLPIHYTNIVLDEFIIMPNHIHGIIIIPNPTPVETGFKPVSTKKPHGLFEFLRALKTFSARRINELRNSPGLSLWQSRFFDRIIRDETELFNIRQYIINNPKNWGSDENNQFGKNNE